MKYEKPAVLTFASACAGIQGHEKGVCLFLDLLLEYTIGAYEADE